MLDVKKLLTKLLKRTNFRIVTNTSSAFTISANNTAWVQVPVPSGQGRPIAVVGYYIQNGYYCPCYNITLYGTSRADFALYNPLGSTTGLITITAYFLMVD